MLQLRAGLKSLSLWGMLELLDKSPVSIREEGDLRLESFVVFTSREQTFTSVSASSAYVCAELHTIRGLIDSTSLGHLLLDT